LGQSNLAMFAVIVVNIWLGVPFTMVALLGGLQSIPNELYEAPRSTALPRGSASRMSPCLGCGRCQPP